MITLTDEQITGFKLNAIEQQDRLTKSLDIIPADNVANCYVRHALFNLAAMLHQINLAEGTSK